MQTLMNGIDYTKQGLKEDFIPTRDCLKDICIDERPFLQQGSLLV